MADSPVKTVLTLGILGVAGWWVYNNFFAGAAAPATGAGTNPATGAGTNLTPTTGTTGSGAGTNPVPAPAVCAGSAVNVLAPLLSAIQKDQGPNFGPNLPGTITIDQADYFLDNICTGMSKQYKLTADDLFPGDPNRGPALNWNAIQGYAKQAGLSAAFGMRPLRVRVNPRMRGRRVMRRVA